MKSFTLGLLIFLGTLVNAQVLELTNSHVKFYSYTVLEDIEAETTKTKGLISLEKNEFFFKIPIKSFDFEKDLMEEHFNENYLESDEFPFATFSGTTDSPMSFEGSKTYMFSGELTIHGKTQKREIEVTLSLDENGNKKIDSKFKVKLVDHKIKIPKVVFANIAEVIDVTINGELIPFVKK